MILSKILGQDVKIKKEQIVDDNRIMIFSGSVTSGNTITINTTWENLGRFKNLIVEAYISSVNARAQTIIPYELISGTADNLYIGRRNTNVWCVLYMYNGIKYLHFIPSSDINTNTIKFDISEGVVTNMYIDY